MATVATRTWNWESGTKVLLGEGYEADCLSPATGPLMQRGASGSACAKLAELAGAGNVALQLQGRHCKPTVTESWVRMCVHGPRLARPTARAPPPPRYKPPPPRRPLVRPPPGVRAASFSNRGTAQPRGASGRVGEARWPTNAAVHLRAPRLMAHQIFSNGAERTRLGELPARAHADGDDPRLTQIRLRSKRPPVLPATSRRSADVTVRGRTGSPPNAIATEVCAARVRVVVRHDPLHTGFEIASRRSRGALSFRRI